MLSAKYVKIVGQLNQLTFIYCMVISILKLDAQKRKRGFKIQSHWIGALNHITTLKIVLFHMLKLLVPESPPFYEHQCFFLDMFTVSRSINYQDISKEVSNNKYWFYTFWGIFALFFFEDLQDRVPVFHSIDIS